MARPSGLQSSVVLREQGAADPCTREAPRRLSYEVRGRFRDRRVHIVKRWWWLLVIGAVVAAFMGYLVANRLPDTYEARAQLLVGPLSADKDTLDAAGAQARTYAALATTTPVLDTAARNVGLTSVRSKVASVNASDITRLISITAHDGDPVRAAAIANALAGVLVARAATGPPPAGSRS